MTPTCQHHGCDALSETKVKEIIGGKVFWWRYLCDVHLEEEYAPWLRLMRR
ncbi:MAG TPA: hypothetical protein VN756_08750 [Solirubrobacterales bacterium]|nr:hypothetical protein [Actinoplanes sp.]HXS47538.1 hypothetical protein [Solirubrobacterales bacterium]